MFACGFYHLLSYVFFVMPECGFDSRSFFALRSRSPQFMSDFVPGGKEKFSARSLRPGPSPAPALPRMALFAAFPLRSVGTPIAADGAARLSVASSSRLLTALQTLPRTGATGHPAPLREQPGAGPPNPSCLSNVRLAPFFSPLTLFLYG